MKKNKTRKANLGKEKEVKEEVCSSDDDDEKDKSVQINTWNLELYWN